MAAASGKAARVERLIGRVQALVANHLVQGVKACAGYFEALLRIDHFEETWRCTGWTASPATASWQSEFVKKKLDEIPTGSSRSRCHGDLLSLGASALDHASADPHAVEDAQLEAKCTLRRALALALELLFRPTDY
jgi:hypothetical protein